MAEDLAETLPAATATPTPKRRPAAFRGRFLVAYAVLGVLGVAGVTAGVLLLTGAERALGTSWASWHPIGSESSYGQQIADYVGRRYRHENGNQIVGVVPGPPEVSDVKVTAVAIEGRSSASTDGIEILQAEDSFMYLLCGLGDGCAIEEGEPSDDRHRLLRREALELAFYTFKYVDDVDSVIVMLPPADQTEAPTALFLEQKDFGPELSRPLADTLSGPDAEHVTAVPELEIVTVDRLTRPFVYQYEFQPLQNASALLVLSPVRTDA